MLVNLHESPKEGKQQPGKNKASFFPEDPKYSIEMIISFPPGWISLYRVTHFLCMWEKNSWWEPWLPLTLPPNPWCSHPLATHTCLLSGVFTEKPVSWLWEDPTLWCDFTIKYSRSPSHLHWAKPPVFSSNQQVIVTFSALLSKSKSQLTHPQKHTAILRLSNSYLIYNKEMEHLQRHFLLPSLQGICRLTCSVVKISITKEAHS